MSAREMVAAGALLAAAAGCATRPARLAVASITPERGAALAPSTTVRVEVAYAVDSFTPGQDGVAALFKTRGGGTWEASRQVITAPQGRLTFQFSGADLLTNAALVRPYQLRFVLDSRDGTAAARTMKEASGVYFDRAEDKGEKSEEERKQARLVPPEVGKGQLLSDMVHDPRYRPRLPPVLNRDGNVVWGLFKLCVDNDGDVFKVTMIKSADNLVNADWMAVLRTLKHRPYTINGEPVPYCYPMRLEVRSVAPPPSRRR